MNRKIAVLYNLNRGEFDYEADFDSPQTINRLQQAIEKRDDCFLIEAVREIRLWIAQIIQFQPNVVFNVAEGFEGAAREALYPALLEQLNFRYTGPGPTELLICHNKALTKRLLERYGIRMPWGKVLGSETDIESIVREPDLPFPLIVKLNSEGSSLGVDDDSIVYTPYDLKQQLLKVWSQYQRNIVVEKYIQGRDFSMTFIEGKGVMGPVEYTYPDSEIYNFRLKTVDNSTVGVIQPNDLSRGLLDEFRTTSLKIIQALDINGYCRIDFRFSEDGKLYVLEVNGQVSFHPQGAFVLAAEPQMVFDELIAHIIDYAHQHRRRTSLCGVI